MEFEQIIKQLDWLDVEQRKNKSSLTTMEDRLASLVTSVNAVAKQTKDLEKNISAIAISASRLDQYNEMLAKQREDFNKALVDIEKKHQKATREATKRHLEELDPVQKELEKLKKIVIPEIANFKSEIKVRATDQVRINDVVAQVKAQIDEILRVHEEMITSQKISDENRRQNVKRVADLQGELTAMRKRVDEARAKADMSVDNIRNMDNRVNELLLSESERKGAQTDFIDQQSLAQIDREHMVKDWQEKFEEFKQQGQSLDAQVATLDETLRAAKKSQETYNELNTRLERRINEISEMQRLAEDRVRQEWVSFKADDQKRWTGYSLSQEESMRDLRKDMNRFEERMAALDDSAQVLQDQLHQTADATEQQLQELMNVAHTWLTAYERIMGHTKKTTRKSAK